MGLRRREMTTRLQDLWSKAKQIRARVTPAILWDAAMVNLALLNLFLICFDFSYLWLRSSYVEFVPFIVRLYDPVKGIEPDPLVGRFVELVDQLEAAKTSDQRARTLSELSELTAEVGRYEPFLRSGQYRELGILESRIRSYVGDLVGVDGRDLPSSGLLARLWTPESPAELERTLSFFDHEIRPLFAVAYRRELDRTGEYADYGWLVDLPFLVLFSIEFYARWFVAVRRRVYPRWFVFPILNWYDLLGIVPFPQFRVFRLVRIASIYVRLFRQGRLGEDAISRTVRYCVNIVSEEVSAKTTVWILEDMQKKIDAGVHHRIIRGVFDQRREAIAQTLANGLRRVIAAQAFRADVRQFLDANLDRVADASPSLRKIPLPKAVLQPLVGAIGRIVFDATVETLGETLESNEGRRVLEEVLVDAVDGLVEELTEGEVETLVSELVSDSLEQMKATVTVREWMQALE